MKTMNGLQHKGLKADKTPPPFVIGLTAIALAFTVWGNPAAADPPPADKPTLDEQLLKDLDNELLEGLDDLPKPKKAAKPGDAEGAPDEPAGEDIGQPAKDDPLARVAHQMRQAERLIPAADQAKKTTKTQQQIVGSLEDLIKQLEKQCQKSGSSPGGSKPGSQQTAQRDSINQPQPKPGQGSKPSDKPARESDKRRGPDDVRKADLAALQNMIKDVWGQLPGKAREQMLQSPPEKFLPKYELLIEKYYERLAEEQRDSP